MEKKRRKIKRRSQDSQPTAKERPIQLAQSSPYSGVRFPEGSKRKAFECYVRNNGNVLATRREIKRAKILGGRTPSTKTIRKWEIEGNWNTLKDMIDDKLVDILGIDDDPELDNFVKNDAAYFGVLNRLRSRVVSEFSKPKGPLSPRNATEALKLLQFLRSEDNVLRDRTGGALGLDTVTLEDQEKISKGQAKKRGDSSPPDNASKPSHPKVIPLSVLKDRAATGQTTSHAEIAREIIRSNQQGNS